MRHLLVLVPLALAGCGAKVVVDAPVDGGATGECAGEYDGQWVGTTISDQLELTADCQYDYTGPGGCITTGTYSKPITSQGSVQVTIDSSSGGQCMPEGTYTCTYTASATSLTFDCGIGSFSYSR